MPPHAVQGLSTSQAHKLLAEHGPNILPEGKRRTRLSHLLSQFTSPLIYVLVIAGIVTYLLHDIKDSLVIFLAVIVNTLLGYYQERKAENALVALRKMLNPMAKVIRDGTHMTIPVADVVPGDMVILAQGDKIPADGVMKDAVTMGVNEAFLTGESTAVTKQTGQEVWMGSVVLSGRGVMEVVATGMHTKMGSIAHEIALAHDTETPLQKRLNRLAGFLAAVVVGLCSVVFLIGIAKGLSFDEIFSTSVALAVAAIPEGMAVSLTVILAIGMQRILKRKALVRRLVAAESLGSVTVIATDKTGTLTEGLMRVTKSELEDEKKALITAVYANNLDDPLEIALWDWAQKNKLDAESLSEHATRESEVPFTSEAKYMSVTIKGVTYIKGAPEIVMDMCKIPEKTHKKYTKVVHEWSESGLRLIGFASAQKGKKATWLGVAALEDPIRKNIKPVMDTCRTAGIRTLMITGDYAGTARAVWAHVQGLTRELHVIDGMQLEKMSHAKLREAVQVTDIFARVSPSQKHRIVKALRQNGEVVALIGDGVNDAPALKTANIGIVVGTASDVAKETADIVLLDSNFKTIVAAIEEGRGMYSNILKVIRYLMSGAFSEIVLVVGSILMGLPIPLTAGQILWVNIITDGLPAVALTVDPKDRNILRRKPIDPNVPLIDGEMRWLISFVSGITGMLCLALFAYYLSTAGLEIARTVTFTALSVGTLVYVFSIRSMNRPLFDMSGKRNMLLYGAVGIGFAFQLAALYQPTMRSFLRTEALDSGHWYLILLTAVLLVLGIECAKFAFSRLHVHHR